MAHPPTPHPPHLTPHPPHPTPHTSHPTPHTPPPTPHTPLQPKPTANYRSLPTAPCSVAVCSAITTAHCPMQHGNALKDPHFQLPQQRGSVGGTGKCGYFSTPPHYKGKLAGDPSLHRHTARGSGWRSSCTMLLHSPLPPTVWQCTEGAPLLTAGWCAMVCWVALCCPLPPTTQHCAKRSPPPIAPCTAPAY